MSNNNTQCTCWAGCDACSGDPCTRDVEWRGASMCRECFDQVRRRAGMRVMSEAERTRWARLHNGPS